jgi:hypothetical protein
MTIPQTSGNPAKGSLDFPFHLKLTIRLWGTPKNIFPSPAAKGREDFNLEL